MIKNKKQVIYLCLTVLLLAFMSHLTAQTKTLGLLKKINGNEENGYVLFSPIGVDTTYLINKCGQKIHFWTTKYTPGFALYLKPNGNLLKAGTYTDTLFGAAGGRGGMIEEYNWNGDLVWSYKIFTDSVCQHHDIYPMPNGNIMVLAWHAIGKTEAISKGRSSKNFGSINELWGERLIEIKPIGTDSAVVVWQWDLFDHIIQDLDSSLPNFGIVGQHPELVDINYALSLQTQDWVHANGIDYNQKLDQIVISAHNFSEIWIIDHSTDRAEAGTHKGGTFDKGGDLLYRWGNPIAYQQGSTADRKLFRQHNARWIRGGLRDSGSIMVFNNGLNRDTAYSSVDIIRTPILSNGSYVSNLPYGPAKASWIYTDSIKTKFYSMIISSAEMLPNGNVMICSGVQGRFFEVTEKGKTVWEYRNPVNLASTQTDGQTAQNNQVFRCSFYSKSYPAFVGKTLNSLGTLERKSYPYSCNYESNPPKVSVVFPRKGDTAIKTNTILVVKFDKAVLKRNGSINIYTNNVLTESINIHSDLIKVVNDSVFIDHMKAFDLKSRISVKFPSMSVSDSSNNLLMIGIDSSEWYFRTLSNYPKIVSKFPVHQSYFQRPDKAIKILFNKTVYKRNSGSISFFENGQLIESFSIQSSLVTINGKEVTINHSRNFKADAVIVVGMDSCFVDSLGLPSQAFAYGDWYFRTAPAIAVLQQSPTLNAKDVTIQSSLKLDFNRPFLIDSFKTIRMYANGIIFKNIPLNDTGVHMQGNSIIIHPGLKFPQGSRVAIQFPNNSLKDSFGYYYVGNDTAAWHFTIEKNSSINNYDNSKKVSIYPIPNAGKFEIQSLEEILNVEIFDMEGRKIEFDSQEISKIHVTVQLHSASKGYYMLRINNYYTKLILVE